MLFLCVSLSLASACSEVHHDRPETIAELDQPQAGASETSLDKEDKDAPIVAKASATEDACPSLSGAASRADIEADDTFEADSAEVETDPCRRLERKTAEQKLERLRAVRGQADLYTLAEALLAEMDRNADGVLSGDELNPNARIVQSYMSKQPRTPPQADQPPGSVSAGLEDQNVSLFVSDLAVILLEYFEMSDKNANGVLDPDEAEWLAATVYPDEAATAARLSGE